MRTDFLAIMTDNAVLVHDEPEYSIRILEEGRTLVGQAASHCLQDEQECGWTRIFRKLT